MPLGHQRGAFHRSLRLQFEKDNSIGTLRNDLTDVEAHRDLQQLRQSIQILVRSAISLEQTVKNKVVTQVTFRRDEVPSCHGLVERLQCTAAAGHRILLES